MTAPARPHGTGGPLTDHHPRPHELSYEALYEHAPCGHVLTSDDGTMIRVNETFLAWTGYSRDKLIGRQFASLMNVGSSLVYETRCLPALTLNGEIREVALELRRRNGTMLPILINSVLSPASDAQPQLIRTALFDATERKNYERELLHARRVAEQSESRVRVLQEASTAFGNSDSETSLTTALAEIATDAFDATFTAVGLADDAGVRMVAGTHPLDLSPHPYPSEPEAQALRTGEAVTMGDLDAAARFSPALVDRLIAARVEAMCVVPLLEDGTARGVLSCFFGRRRQFSDKTVELQTALARHAAQVLQRVRLQNQLHHMAMHDPLTGLGNRQLLQRRLDQAISSAQRHQRPVSLVFFDLDGFKPINDQLGHATGDTVLKVVADRLRDMVRREDDLARFGGDEFVAVFEGADADAARCIAERIKDVIRQPLTGVASGYPLTASIGVAVHDLPCEATRSLTADAMVRRADAAMYESKARGKNSVTVVRV